MMVAGDYFRDRLATAALCALLAIVLAAVLAPQLAPQNPYDLAQLDIHDSKLAPGSGGEARPRYWLGTDEQGRDIASGILYGLRISLFVGVVATACAFALGTLIGLLAAWRGGWYEIILMRAADLQLSFPSILIALILLAVLGPGEGKIIGALVLVQWAYYARTARSAALTETRRDYVGAAVALGIPAWRIVLRHVLPNCLPPLLVLASVQVAHAITLEATLSFLGLGTPVTEPSLGLLIANGFAHLLSGRYWISFFPGLALVITIAAINIAAERLREVLDPRHA